MKESEITRIITVQITVVKRMNEYDLNEALQGKDKFKNLLEKGIKDGLDADDVKVTDIQDFILDK